MLHLVEPQSRAAFTRAPQRVVVVSGSVRRLRVFAERHLHSRIGAFSQRMRMPASIPPTFRLRATTFPRPISLPSEEQNVPGTSPLQLTSAVSHALPIGVSSAPSIADTAVIHPADREIDELATQPSFRRRRAGRRLCFFLHRYFRGAGIGVAHGFGARPAVASAREIAPELLYGMKIQLFRRMHGARHGACSRRPSRQLRG